MTDTTQSVVSDATARAPKPEATAENADARTETLDDILKAFDSGDGENPEETSKPETKPTDASASQPAASATDPVIKVLKDKLEALERVESRKQKDIVIGRIKGDLNVNPDLVEAYVNMRATRDPRLATAYVNRDRNPAAWSKIESELAKDVRTQFGGQAVDTAVTETREAITAAVRGSSTAAKQADLSKDEVFAMSKSDFDALQRKMGVRP